MILVAAAASTAASLAIGDAASARTDCGSTGAVYRGSNDRTLWIVGSLRNKPPHRASHDVLYRVVFDNGAEAYLVVGAGGVARLRLTMAGPDLDRFGPDALIAGAQAPPRLLDLGAGHGTPGPIFVFLRCDDGAPSPRPWPLDED